MSPLRERFLHDLQLAERSESTQMAYVRWVANFARLFGKSPDRLGREHVRLQPPVTVAAPTTSGARVSSCPWKRDPPIRSS